MKRAKFLEGSNGQLSAITQLIFILVLFLGSYVDDIKGASVSVGPSNTLTTSGTPSMSLSLSVSFTQTTSFSQTMAPSPTTTVTQGLTPTASGVPTPTATVGTSGSGTVTMGLTPTATAVPTITATVGTSGSVTVTTLLTPTATGAPSIASTPTASLSQGASPSQTPFPSVDTGSRAYNKYFCGNMFKEPSFTEQCDFGAANVPKYTCCTPSCHHAKGGRICAPRFNNCWKFGRCSGNKAGCRDSTPKSFGVGCSENRGFCNGLGECRPKAEFWYWFYHAKSRGQTMNKKSIKKYMKNKKLKKNFNLAEFTRKNGNSILNTNTSVFYPVNEEDGYFEELEKIIREEKHIKLGDFDPLDDVEADS